MPLLLTRSDAILQFELHSTKRIARTVRIGDAVSMHHDLQHSDTIHETYDPADWDAFRTAAHGMVDDMLDYLKGMSSEPVWQPMPDATESALREPLPTAPQGIDKVYNDFRTHVLPFANGNRHPRFYGWVQGNGTPLGMMADMLASGMNAHLAGFNHAPARVEHQVIDWLVEMLGMPAGTSGVLVSGCTVANLVGLMVARRNRAGFDVRASGLNDDSAPQLTCYCSAETHSWITRAVDVLGLGTNALTCVPVSGNYRMDLGALRTAIEADCAAGKRPFCVSATAGTVNTGAVDDLHAIADLCSEHNLWMHVDGAFGALVRASGKHRDMIDGLDRADSVAFDLHKWGSLPFEVGCILVRDADAHAAAFPVEGNYLGFEDRGVIAGGLPFAERGLELTRSFKALKVWMSLKAEGADKLGRMIDQNIAQAACLAREVEASDQLELLAPVPMNLVCFRYRGSVADALLDAVNREILIRLQEQGRYVLSSTTIGDAFALRAAIVNHRATFQDFHDLVVAVIEIGNAVTKDIP
jgi:glutamate/tyrosine decarboxylase-like PLP-dependent enzyme